jgi:hypothetical protein
VRQHYQRQRRFDCTAIAELKLNYECRDGMIPVLAGLQHLYTGNSLRNKVVRLVAEAPGRTTMAIFESCLATKIPLQPAGEQFPVRH